MPRSKQKSSRFASLAAFLAIVATAIVISAIVLKVLPVPFFWIDLLWAVAGVVIGFFALPSMRLPLLIVSALLIGLALSELIIDTPPELSLDVGPDIYQGDPILGWSPKPSRVSRATARVGDEVIYDVVYSIDAAGRRIAPPDRGSEVEGCLFFFSDSFTFGEGVNDNETYPYQLGLKTQGRFRIINFSFLGYGAEQMLAILERGDLVRHPPCEPTHVFYAALPHHVLRAAGKTSFSLRDPRYKFGADGTLQYIGTDWNLPRPGGWGKRLTDQLAKSQVYRVLATQPPITTDTDIELNFAIVNQAFRLLNRRWPNAKLYVISWDIDDFYSKGKARFQSELQQTGAIVLFIDDMLPGYSDDQTKYAIHRFERHPNPLAYQLVASYLADHVLPPAIRGNR